MVIHQAYLGGQNFTLPCECGQGHLSSFWIGPFVFLRRHTSEFTGNMEYLVPSQVDKMRPKQALLSNSVSLACSGDITLCSNVLCISALITVSNLLIMKPQEKKEISFSTSPFFKLLPLARAWSIVESAIKCFKRER